VSQQKEICKSRSSEAVFDDIGGFADRVINIWFPELKSEQFENKFLWQDSQVEIEMKRWRRGSCGF